ncbi:MAG: hypothetical protein L6V93_07070 [Clostridiales bacterium]|nr:MAG: hypothetical protein L6V93_07070 [Clostridiales bacterium]
MNTRSFQISTQSTPNLKDKVIICINLRKKVYDTIIKHNMLSGGESVLAGFSGGADSTALVCALMSIDLRFALRI